MSNRSVLKRRKTTEGAAQRYLDCYEKQYVGSPEFGNLMKDLTRKKILLLRAKAPIFFEEKLPNLINQAASVLLTHNPRNKEGYDNFHQAHSNFLEILDELGRCQPSGQVDYQVELDRLMEINKLTQNQEALRREIDELEAREVDLDDLSDDEGGFDSYKAHLDELDQKKKELKNCSILLAKISGEAIDNESEFELIPRQGSVLERLSPEQIEFLAERLKTLGENAKNKRSVIYEQKPFIEENIKKLGLNSREFSALDSRTLVDDIYESYLDFFRREEDERRAEWHEDMLNNKILRPREGTILESPNDITPEMEARLEESRVKRIRGIHDLRAKYDSQVLSLEEEQRIAKETGDDAVSTDDDGEKESEEVLAEISAKKEFFARVKEEPRSDYAEYFEDILDEEDDLNETGESEIQINDGSGSAGDSINDDEDEQEEEGQNSDPRSILTALLGDEDEDKTTKNLGRNSQTSCRLSNGAQTISISSQENMSEVNRVSGRFESSQLPGSSSKVPQAKNSEDDEDALCLGMVAPMDKIEVIDIDDDDDE